MSHLAFYGENNISPVRQDISDLNRHFQRREALYRQLGILPNFVTGRSVLEVGPGSGYNSLYTASLRPAKYTLVEGNPTGLAQMEALFADHPQLTGMTKIVPSRLEQWQQDQRYDFVLCEGLLSGVDRPHSILDRLADATADGGTLVVTCVDHISHFPETLRRAFVQLATRPGDALAVKVDTALAMFEPHLRTLSGMSRRDDDWVIDNLLHPSAVTSLINFPEAIASLSKRCDFNASAPHFVTDWRWYKDIAGVDFDFSQRAISQYWEQAHNLLDYRAVLPARARDGNLRLYQLCSAARARLGDFERTRDMVHMDSFRLTLRGIVREVFRFSRATGDALEEAADLLSSDRIDPDSVAGAEKFGPLFGRGQQYLSFTRKVAA